MNSKRSASKRKLNWNLVIEKFNQLGFEVHFCIESRLYLEFAMIEIVVYNKKDIILEGSLNPGAMFQSSLPGYYLYYIAMQKEQQWIAPHTHLLRL